MGDILTDATEIKNSRRNYYEQLYIVIYIIVIYIN